MLSASAYLLSVWHSRKQLRFVIIVRDKRRSVVFMSMPLLFSELARQTDYVGFLRPGCSILLKAVVVSPAAPIKHQSIVRVPFVLKKKKTLPGKSATWVATVQKTDLQRAGREARTKLSKRGKKVPLDGVKHGWEPHPRTIRPSPEQVFAGMKDFEQYGPTVTRNTVWQSRRLYRTYNSWRTPNFGRLKKRYLPQNPYNLYIEEIADGSFFRQVVHTYPPAAETSNGVTLGPYQAYGPGVVTLYANHTAAASNRALGKLIDKADQGINNLAQDFVEMDQTTRMITKTVVRISGAIKALRARNLPQALKFLWDAKAPVFRQGSWMAKGLTPKQMAKKLSGKELANNWLELQYGWKPLLQDVQGVMQSLAQLNIGNASVQDVSAFATSDERYSTPLTQNTGGVIYAAGTSVRIINSRCKYSLRYRVDDHAKAFLRQTGFLNPINLAWEVLPWSFVVDWFLPIGNYLQGINAWEGLTFLDGHMTQFTQEILICDCRGSGFYQPNAQDTILTEVVGNFFRRVVRYDRTKLTSFPTSRPPSFKNPFSTVHVLNALALLRGSFRPLHG